MNMKRRRRMTKKQLKYFGKRKRSKRVKVVKMARRRSYRGRARSYAKRGIGSIKSMLPPVLGGVADTYLDSMLPVQGVGATAVGMFMHDGTLKTIGLYKIGGSIGNLIPLPGVSGSSGGFA